VRLRLDELGKKHDRLSSLGILAPADVIRSIPDEIDATTLSTLSIYVKDTERKLAVFDDLAARIDALTELVNKRFQFKHFFVRRERGFVFKTDHGADVPVAGLSSGEQHVLVMLYELLFRTRPDTLVLIDEPEISLHLAWQQQFLDDIEKIVAISRVDVLIATHSADIIDRHWDWTVSLEGPPA
jgi:predicted ATP-binding protein involved in virulence